MATWIHRSILPAVALSTVLLAAPRLARAADTDADGLEDEWELSYFVSLAQENGSSDPDGDLLTNLEEQALGTDPTRQDTDGDGLPDAFEANSPGYNPLDMDADGDFLSDAAEFGAGTDPSEPDSDSDGLTDFIEVSKGYNPLSGDTDQGGVWDGEEVLVDKTDPIDPADDAFDSDDDGTTYFCEQQLGTNPFASDSDGDWLPDGQENANLDCLWQPELGETDPANADTDGDGLDDGWEVMVYETDPFVPDTDGDGLTDGEEHLLRLTQFECLDPANEDSDRDGLLDSEEIQGAVPSSPCYPDTDEDGIFDISELFDQTGPADPTQHAPDPDNDGLSDDFEQQKVGSKPDDPDTDGDGLNDAQELLPLDDGFVTAPLDADTDDDGILDGKEGGILVEGYLSGGTSPVAWDSDKDALSDGQEKGLTAPQKSPKDPDATDPAKFKADSQQSTTTNPLDNDTDDDTLDDGEEDKDLDGKQDNSETDPDLFDTDGDGMDDAWETAYWSPVVCAGAPGGPLDPLDAGDKYLDNDNDGLSNFKEYQLTKIVKGEIIKNQTNPCKVDTDGDGLGDKTEVYGTYGLIGPQGQGTDPNDTDTDDDQITDGNEDKDHNGKWNPLTETNPLQKDTDGDGLDDGFEGKVVGTDPKKADTDGDGLSDGMEYNLVGTNPLVPDTDADGLGDGVEAGVSGKDSCPADKSNPHVKDTDGDGLFDGLEDADGDGCFDKDAGETSAIDPDTDGDKLNDGVETGKGKDEDPASTTDPLNKDSDEDGLWDSHEDKNKNGKVDPDETDPNVKDTDNGGVPDGTEVLVDGTDPLNPLDDLVADPDGDGLTNGEEKTIGTNPYDADTDGDTIPDPMEVGENHLSPPDHDGDGDIDAVDPDSDADGIPDAVEAGDADPETPPVDSNSDETADYLDDDSDGDGIPDSVEWAVDANGDGLADPDADEDGTPNYLDLDSDDAQEEDAVEGTGDTDGDGIPNFVDPVEDSQTEVDSDGDGLTDQEEEEDTLTDPFNPDTDDDGLNDKEEVDGVTDPLDADCDDDGLEDGLEAQADGDADGLPGPLDPDGDDDGVFDGTEAGVEEPAPPFEYPSQNGQTYSISGTDPAAGNFEPDQDSGTTTDPTLADSDQDGASDGAEDPNANGTIDLGEMDPLDPDDAGLTPAEIDEVLADEDGDGLTDRQEWAAGILTPDGDGDEDGLSDGMEHNWRCDTDRDGLRNLLDPDSDGDGLGDGQEEGLASPSLPEHTALRYRNFTPDADPATTTFMLLPDSDHDGMRDGREDANHNGLVDPGETDPFFPEDEVDPDDADSDLLPDAEEKAFGLDPADCDVDDDGLLDGLEPNWAFDTDRDGLAAALEPDADNDGLADGTEAGVFSLSDPDCTDMDKGNFILDSEMSVNTFAAVPDTDRGGLSDGSEDTDKNGVVDSGETDPSNPADDADLCTDTDGDLLCDVEETLWLTDPLDADSDDDGLLDGAEHNWRFDSDADGLINALDPDSDGDDLPDGLELGAVEPIPAGQTEIDGQVVPVAGTDLEAGFFSADLEPSTTTFMLVADSDRGGVADGQEDTNRNGRIDPGETNPEDPTDDGKTNPDVDGDGIPNDVETAIGTDPTNADSDGDTIPDGVEVGKDQQAPPDSDSDGTIDALDADSDGDSIPDATEAGDSVLETPPVDTDGDETPDYLDLDSDEDGLTDELENTFYHTDPTQVDTDGGGADDQLEVTKHMTDPLDPDDDYRGWFEDGASVQGGVTCAAAASGAGRGPASQALPAMLALLGILLAGLRLLSGRGGGGPSQAHPPRVGRPSTAARGRLAPSARGAWLVGVFLACALGFLLMSSQARADYTPDPNAHHPDAYHTTIEANSFRLAPDGEGILSVQTGTLPRHLELRAGFTLHYADSPLTVIRDGEVLRTLVDHRVESHLSAAVGLFDLFDVGLQVPVTFYQDAVYPGLKLGDVGWGGVGDLAAFARLRAPFPETFPIALALFLPVYFPTGDENAYMGTGRFATHPSLAVSARFRALTLALNAGYRWQGDTTLLNVVDADRITGGLGLSFAPGGTPWEAGVELTGAARADEPFARSEEIQAEVDAGVRYRIGPFRVLVGGGKGLTPGFSTPDWRAFAGLDYGWRPDPDRDKDGIPNLEDRCPDKPEDPDGFQDADGCPDEDNDRDGIHDPEDKCINEPEDLDAFEDEDGCPDFDNDKDTVPDKTDQCPLQAEDLDKFEDEDGCPDLDNDGDGIPDKVDKCPLEKEVFNDYQDEDGCPDKKLAEFQKEARRIQILDKVHFKFMRAELEPSAFPILDQVAQILAENPQVLFVQVEGHTDKTGSHQFNMELSLARAESVVGYLIGRGIDPARLGAVGYGYDRRIDYRSGPEANLNNRRVEFNILKFAE